MTEDMLDEQTEIIMKLGKSEDGSKYLAQMQSASLFSDVQAFKVFYNPYLSIAALLQFFNKLLMHSFVLLLGCEPRLHF